MAVSVSDSYQSKIIHPNLTLLALYLRGYYLPTPGEAAGQAAQPAARRQAGPYRQRCPPASPSTGEPAPGHRLGTCLCTCHGLPGLAKTLWDAATARKTSPRPARPLVAAHRCRLQDCSIAIRFLPARDGEQRLLARPEAEGSGGGRGGLLPSPSRFTATPISSPVTRRGAQRSLRAQVSLAAGGTAFLFPFLSGGVSSPDPHLRGAARGGLGAVGASSTALCRHAQLRCWILINHFAIRPAEVVGLLVFLCKAAAEGRDLQHLGLCAGELPPRC